MQFNVIVKEYTNDKLSLQATINEKCSSFTWRGYTESCQFESIETTKNSILVIDNPKEFLKKYTQVVCYAYASKNPKEEPECFISDYLRFTDIEIKPIEIIPIKSHKGFSIFMAHQPDKSNITCDEYKLFGVKDGKTKCVCSTHLFYTHLSNLNYEYYYAEGYDNGDIDGVKTHIIKFRSKDMKVEQLLEMANTKMGMHDAQSSLYSELTVIIPIFDINDNIKRTIDSTIATKNCQMTTILVNATEDANIKKMCSWYENNYPNFVSKTSEKADYGALINSSIKLASGISKSPYTAILTTKEFVHPYAYKQMLSQMKNTNAKAVFASHLDYDKENKKDLDVLINAHGIFEMSLLNRLHYPEDSEFPTDCKKENGTYSFYLAEKTINPHNIVTNTTLCGYDNDETSFNYDDLENVLFTRLVYPINHTENHDDIVSMLNAFVSDVLPALLDTYKEMDDLLKISMIIKHIINVYDLKTNTKYCDESYDGMKKRIDYILSWNKFADQKIFLWMVKHEYLEKNINKA